MNIPLNPSLTMSIAADRRHTLFAEAEVSRSRKAHRLARRLARQASTALEDTSTHVV